MFSRIPILGVITVAALLALAACSNSGTSFSAKGVAPCTPVAGSPVDPCDPDLPSMEAEWGAHSRPELDNTPVNIREILDGGADATWATHLIVRGTYLPNTVRCSSGHSFSPPSHLQDEFSILAGTFSAKCYIDVRANAYIVGDGPATLTVMATSWIYANANPDGEDETTRYRGIGHSQTWAELVNRYFPGREEVLFLAPSEDLSTEAWRLVTSWDVQRQENGTIMVVHPERNLWQELRPNDYQTHKASLEMTLSAFTQATTSANQARMTEYGGRVGADTSTPMLTTNANQLSQYFTSVGATAPAPPPPPCGLVVTDQFNNPGLVADCAALLESLDALRGTGALNWSTETAIASWDSVTVEGTPQRITRLKLANKSLTGTVPERLAALDALTELKLSGNALTGCIPLALNDVATNDLAYLTLLYCQPPAPEGLAAGAVGEASVPLTWTVVSNTSRYRVEYREGTAGDWTVDDDTITTASHTVDELKCDSEYQFRVSAYGSGTVYMAAWGDSSAPVAATTGACTPPVFGATSYSFSVTADAAVDTAIGSVSATDDSGNPVTYAVTEGNDDGYFALDESTGEITAAASLTGLADTSYTLTVEAEDESGGAATVTVTVTIRVT